VHVYGIWWINDRCIWWLILILILLLKKYLLKIEEHLVKKTCAILFICFFRRASEYPLFYSLGHLSIFSYFFHLFFFPQYFCIATCIFLQQNFRDIITRTLSIYLGAVLYGIFLGVYSQCKSKIFSGGSR
jgi:hypothetical protein